MGRALQRGGRQNGYPKNACVLCMMCHLMYCTCNTNVLFVGTFIAVAQLLKVVDDRCARSVDVFNLVYELRKERKHMVQTEQQYAYVYECALEYYMRRSKVAREIDAEQEKNKDSANGGS